MSALGEDAELYRRERDERERRGRRKANGVADLNDLRPTIRLSAGDIERIVDEAERALLKANLGLFQRDNAIVFVGASPTIAAHGREIVAQRIFERGDHALLEDLSNAAHFEKYDARAKGFVTADPPLAVVKTLRERVGKLRFHILSGVVNAPTLRADGSVLTTPGYDLKTGLHFDPLGVAFPPISDRPSRDDALMELGRLTDLIETFPFVGEADRSVALSAMLTACVRRCLPTAPLHAFTAPVAGSGKSTLVDIASVVATGHEAGVVAQGHNEEELEKRLASLLLAGDAMISVDNCERSLGGEFLCQALTQLTVKPRILGKSEAPDVSTGAFVTATGNNLILVGDLTRRAIMCRLDPKVERPETRVFEHDPIATAKGDRPGLVAAVLTILRAYHVAGRPGKPAPLGSFETWSDLIRGALLWLDCADPVETMDELRKADPHREDLLAVMTHWKSVIGSDRVTAAEVIKRATEMQNSYEAAGFQNPEFREALLAIAGQGGAINGRRFGRWLSANQKRIVGGMRFEQFGSRGGVALWAII